MSPSASTPSGARTEPITGSTSPARSVVVPLFSNALHAGSDQVGELGGLGQEQIGDDDERRRAQRARDQRAIREAQHRVRAEDRERRRASRRAPLRASRACSSRPRAGASRPRRRRDRSASSGNTYRCRVRRSRAAEPSAPSVGDHHAVPDHRDPTGSLAERRAKLAGRRRRASRGRSCPRNDRRPRSASRRVARRLCGCADRGPARVARADGRT